MREILFRGKSNRGWVYGSVLMPNINYPNATGAYIFRENSLLNINYDMSDNEGGTITLSSVALVSLKTVGQYTGLSDKNGERIFEGDFIVSDHGYEAGEPLLVVWDDASWCSKHNLTMPKDLQDFVPAFWKVVGNIHDNPELLERKPG